MSDRWWHTGRHWIDAAGRLTIAEVPLVADEFSNSVPNDSETPDGLLQRLALASLPFRHKLRAQFQCRRPDPSPPTAIEDLPNYRSHCLMERIAAGRMKFKEIQFAWEHLPRGAEKVTAAQRFVNAMLILLFLSPLFWVGAVFVTMQVMTTIKPTALHLETLASLKEIQENWESYPVAYEGLTEAEKAQWRSPAKIAEVQQLIDHCLSELRYVHKYALGYEKLMLKMLFIDTDKVEAGQSFVAKELLDLKTRQPQQSEPVLDVQLTFGLMLPKTMPLNGFVANVRDDVELWQPELNRPDREIEKLTQGSVMIPLACLVVWTALTRGGMAPRISGLAVMRRDGRRLSMVRTGLRTLVLLLPFVILPLLAVELQMLDLEWLWFTYYVKTAAYLLPVLCLISCIIWPQVGPLDRLFQTVAVPR